MPSKKGRGTTDRMGVRLPQAMVDEVDRLIAEHAAMSYNRQQFVESAVREKIERLRSIAPKGSPKEFRCTYCGQVVYSGTLETSQDIQSFADAGHAHKCPAKATKMA